MANQILHRRDTAANWTAANPVLGAGEIGVESDTNTFKMGDGTTAWASLDYFSGGGGSEINAVATYTVGAGGDFATIAALSEYFLAQRHATAWEVSGNGRQRAGFITIDLQGLNHTLGGAYISFEWFGSWLVFTNGAIGNGTLVFTNSNVRFANGFAAGYTGNTLSLQANGAFLFDSNDDTNSFSNLNSVYMSRGSYLQIWNAYTNPIVATSEFTADTGSVIYVAGNTFNCRSIYSYDNSHVYIAPSTSPELSSTAIALSAARYSSVQIDNQPVTAAAGRLSVSLGSSVVFDGTAGANTFGSATGTSNILDGSSVVSRTNLTIAHALTASNASTVRVLGTATVSGAKTAQDSSAIIDSTDSIELHPGLPTADPSISNALWSSSGVLMLSGGTPPSSYADADVDTHLNTSTATSNQILSWTGSDYAWTDDQTGGGGSTGPFPELLLKGDVSVTQDDSLNGYTFTTTNTPTLDTGDKQFGAGSMSFPANAKITTNETINFGTSTFCIEAWFKPTSVSGTVYWASKPPTGNFCWLYISSGIPSIYYAGSGHSVTSSLSSSAWNHVAFVHDGTNLKGYFNGVEEYSVVIAASDLGDFVWAFGGTDAGVAAASSWYSGLIDDLRITIGDPVYTANFTPAEHPIPVANPLGASETDVTITSPTTGQVLEWNGSKWVNATPASPAIDETGRVETQDYVQFTNSGGNDRMFLKVSDAVSTNTWRGASGLGGYQFDVGTVNQAVVIEDGANGVKLVGYHQETGGNEGLEIHGIGTTGATSTIRLMTDNTTGVRVTGSGKVYLENLPTADPVSAGQLWNDSGTLKVSAG